MPAYDTNRQVPLGSVTTFQAVALVERALDALRTWWLARGTDAALRQLSDRQLADIGLHRGMIADLATTLARS